MLDCNPTHPLPGTDCLTGKFFEGILQNGGAEYFDVVSYHGYALFLTLPEGISGLYDKYGNIIEIPASQITTTVNSPIYIEFQP